MIAMQNSFRKGMSSTNESRTPLPCVILITLLLGVAMSSVTADFDEASVAARIHAVENGLTSNCGDGRRYEPAEQSLSERMDDDNVPGLSIAVINDGQVEWAKGYGVLHAERGRPVDSETLFQAASISKPVAIAATLRLVEASTLSLDIDVNHWLESWRLPADGYTRYEPVTLRRIANHTAGLSVHGFPGYKLGAELPTIPEILDGRSPANTGAVRVERIPGESFRYSGGGLMVLQQVIVDATGQPFAWFARSSVLEPLMMERSTFEQPLPSPLWSNVAIGHDRSGEPIEGGWHVYPEQAAAGLWTTPTELARLVIELQRTYAGTSRAWLQPATVKQMFTASPGTPVGLGWFLDDNPKPRFFHGGTNRGFAAHVHAYVSEGLGVVMMANSDNAHAVINDILRRIIQVYCWP